MREPADRVRRRGSVLSIAPTTVPQPAVAVSLPPWAMRVTAAAIHFPIPSNVAASIQLAERLGPDAKVVTLMANSGLKYLSTDVYKSAQPERGRQMSCDT